jgi:hypothetical protein
MTSLYNPNGTAPAPTTGANNRTAILSSTNAAPIQVTMSSAPGWNDQDTVEFEGHATNTGVNGVFVVTQISGTIYSLNGSTGVAVGGATGYGTDYSLTPAFTVIGDGDLLQASALNPPVEGVANYGPFLYRLAGKYRLYNVFSGGRVADTDLVTAWSSLSVTSTSFNDLTSGTALLGLPSPTPVLAASDVLDIHFIGTAQHQAVVSGTSTISLGLSASLGFGSPANALIAGSTQFVDFVLDGLTNLSFTRVSLRATIGATQGPFQIGLQAAKAGSANATIIMVGSYKILAYQYRLN